MEHDKLVGQGYNYGAPSMAAYPPTFGSQDPMTGGEAGALPSMPSAPSAPPPNMPGYEGTPMGPDHNVPPPDGMLPQPGPRPNGPPQTYSIPAISEEEAKEALMQFVSSKCCYSKEPVNGMVFTELLPHNTYRYHLETFTEERTTAWEHEPFSGNPSEAVHYEPAPLPWDILVNTPSMFTPDKKKVPVPNTSSIRPCNDCLGMARKPCSKCTALGRVTCWHCNGSGRRMGDEMCTHCSGQGLTRCMTCSGSGQCSCHTCVGKGQLKFFISLTVKWKNELYEYVADEQTGFPTKLFKEANGQQLFVDEQPLLWPLIGFPDPGITQASQNAISEMQTKFRTCRIIRQRHRVDLIPLTKVVYDWKGVSYDYFVYGTEKKVYAPNYPAKCSCCAIL
ncbi:protein SSUH2 homolog isoform X2 [Lampetra fluviatilis]